MDIYASVLLQAMSKSIIYLDREYKWNMIDGEQGYRAPFTLSDDDRNQSSNSINERMRIALEKTGRIYCLTSWGIQAVAYTKKTS